MVGMDTVAKYVFGRRRNFFEDPYASGNENQRRNQERLFGDLYGRHMGGHRNFPLGHQSRLGGFGYPRVPRRPGYNSYNSYSGGFRRPLFSPMSSGYHTRSSPYRSPYIGYGYRSRSNYGRSPWNTRAGYSPSYSRRGYPPPTYRHESFSSRWYDNGLSDDDDEMSDYEDTYYRPSHGGRRSYATDYDDEDEDYLDEEESDCDEEDWDGYHPPHGVMPGGYDGYGYSGGSW